MINFVQLIQKINVASDEGPSTKLNHSSVILTQPLQSPSYDLSFLVTCSCKRLSTSHFILRPDSSVVGVSAR